MRKLKSILLFGCLIVFMYDLITLLIMFIKLIYKKIKNKLIKKVKSK